MRELSYRRSKTIVGRHASQRLRLHLLGAAHEPVLDSIRIASPESVEVTFSDFDGLMKGIRFGLADVLAAPERIRVSTIEELASDLVHIGVCEPRALDEFLPPDRNGVRWLPTHRWLE